MEETMITHKKELFNYAFKLSKDKQDAEDLVQDTYVRLFTRKEFGEPIKNEKSYMMSILHNIFVDASRRKMRRLQHQSYVKRNIYNHSEPSVNNIESDLLEQDIYRAIQQIKQEWREPFLMFYQGFQYDEMAIKTGVKVEILRSRIFYARRELAQILRGA
jgi:RNA polymerase sigma-70 factor, ECF subfamily